MNAATLVRLVKQAGAGSEAATARNGFLSYHAETHAVGMGIAAGYLATATGEAKLLGVVYAAAVYGRATGETEQRRRILRDVATEPHYALGGVVVGALLGVLTRLVVGPLDLSVPV